MGRRAPQYTVAFIDDDGDLEVATFGDDFKGAKERLATYADGKARLWTTPPLQHRLRTEPTVEIIDETAPARKRTRGPRKAKQAVPDAAPAGAKGTLFDAASGELVPTPTPPARGKSTTTPTTEA
jgi:hypothetical protein